MASSISTVGINSDFPIAGTNNSSQGFRDNFAAIKIALESAKAEITELSDITKLAVLTKPVETQGNYFNNDLEYNLIIRPQFRGAADLYSENYIVGGTVIIDFFRGGIQKIFLSSNCRLSFENFPRGSKSGSVRLLIEVTSPGLIITFMDSLVHSQHTGLVVNNAVTFANATHYLLDIISVSFGDRYFISAASGF